MTNASSSFGTLLKKGNGANPETFATVAEVKDIAGPEMSADMEDVTSHSSPSGWKEKVPTLLDGGKISFPVNYISSDPTHDKTTGLVADFTSKTKRNWKLYFPDNTGFSFAAYVGKVKFAAKVKGVMTGDIELEISGLITPF